MLTKFVYTFLLVLIALEIHVPASFADPFCEKAVLGKYISRSVYNRLALRFKREQKAQSDLSPSALKIFKILNASKSSPNYARQEFTPAEAAIQIDGAIENYREHFADRDYYREKYTQPERMTQLKLLMSLRFDYFVGYGGRVFRNGSEGWAFTSSEVAYLYNTLVRTGVMSAMNVGSKLKNSFDLLNPSSAREFIRIVDLVVDTHASFEDTVELIYKLKNVSYWSKPRMTPRGQVKHLTLSEATHIIAIARERFLPYPNVLQNIKELLSRRVLPTYDEVKETVLK